VEQVGVAARVEGGDNALGVRPLDGALVHRLEQIAIPIDREELVVAVITMRKAPSYSMLGLCSTRPGNTSGRTPLPLLAENIIHRRPSCSYPGEGDGLEPSTCGL
jgi:hypothetical protein